MSGNPEPADGQAADEFGRTDYPAVPRFIPHERHADDDSPERRQSRHHVSIPRPFFRRHLELGPLTSAPGSARGHVRAVLKEWSFEGQDFIETAGLVVTELVTNAVHATRILDTPLPLSVHLWLQGNRKRVLVTVWDANPNPPILKEDVPPDAETGRGLFFVDYFSARWGWYEPHDLGGKCVWCEITRSSAVQE